VRELVDDEESASTGSPKKNFEEIGRVWVSRAKPRSASSTMPPALGHG
jgi:hypothetical protein